MRIILLACCLAASTLAAPPIVVQIDQPKPPPHWALAERALLKAYTEAAAEFAAKYVDERGFFRCIERWGGNDGPDDVMETFTPWTLLYALGAPDSILELYRRIWEGHLVQFTHARAPSTEFARNGMYYKEFPTAFDWEHTGEGLAAFHFYALAAPEDPQYVRRMRRFAGFYMNEDPEAPNYDPKHKIIRSLHNGSRGPKLTPASVFDWGGESVPGDPGKDGNILHSRVRYFDPERRRAGLPEDVAALVEKIRPNDVVLTLVNTSPIHARVVVVQTGAFAEHQCVSVEVGGKKVAVDAPHFSVRLAPGSGDSVTITMKRYANQPTAAFPWDR